VRERLFGLRIKTLTGRLLIAAALWTVLVLAVGGVVLSVTFQNYVENDFNQRLTEQMDDVLGLMEVNTQDQLQFRRNLSDQRYDTPYSGHYWQITEKDGDTIRSRSLWDTELQVNHSHTQFTILLHDISGPEDQMLRIAERDVTLPEAPERVFRVQIASHLEEVQSAVEAYDQIVIWSLILIAVAIIIAVFAQVRFALSPIRRVRRSLKDVRQGRIPRLDEELPDDIAPLADEINALIKHNEQIISRARTHVGNLAHALKTPLSVLSNEAENLKDERLKEQITTQTATMQSHINHHLKRARIAGGGAGHGANIRTSIEGLKSAIERLFTEKNLKISLDIRDNLIFAGEKEDLDEIIGNLMDNAAKWCKSNIAVTVTALPDAPLRPRCEISVEDDGKGVAAKDFDSLFERGMRLDEQTPGTGLGLNIVREIAELSGGAVRLDKSNLGGLRVIVSLPTKG